MKKDIQQILNTPGQRWANFLHRLKARLKRRHRQTVAQLAPYVPAGGVILDIGANFGYFAKEFSRLHGKSCTVLCFEPVSYNFAILRDATGRLANVRRENIALSNDEGMLEIKIPIKSSGRIGPALAHAGAETRDYVSEQVRARRLDDYIADARIARVDFIKLDVEGAEILVFEGAVDTLKKHKPSIFCEINDDYIGRIGRRAQEAFDLLLPLGYQAFIAKKGSPPRKVAGYDGAADYIFSAA